MKVNKDGTFSGSYHDSDMGATGDGYLIGNDVDTLNGKALLNVTSGADKGYTFYDFSAAVRSGGEREGPARMLCETALRP
jgi:hypothetical protein